MRRIFFTTFFALFAIVSFAQRNESSLIKARIKDGSILVGGNLGGSYQEYKGAGSSESGRVITFRTQLKSGYFFWPDFAAGFNLGIDHTSINFESRLLGERHTYVIGGPFIRYYADNGIFGELNLGVGVDVKNRFDEKTNIRNASLGIGYAYFLNEKFSIEPLLSFYYTENRLRGRDQSLVDRQFGPVLSVGFQVYLYHPTVVLPTR